MAKKKNKTFAERAKKIISSYKRADFDPIEKAALEGKLSALQQEQETYKQTNQIGEYKCGGKMYEDGGLIDPNFEEMYQPESITTIPNVTEESFGLQSSAPEIPTDSSPEYTPYSTSIAPSLISGATSALGNIYLANQQRNTSNVNLPRVSTPEVSLERGRQAAQREATRAGQRVKYAAKTGARTRGELMANQVAGEAAISGQLGETLSASHEKEALVNANMKAGMDKYNAEMAAKEEMINNANKIKDKEAREAYLAAAIGTIPQMTRDINAIQSQDRMVNVLGDKYGWYMEDNPDAKWYQKKKQPVVKFRG